MLSSLDYYAVVHDPDVTQGDVAEWRNTHSARDDEPVMHVKASPKGAWHRMAIDRSRTACGEALGAYATRDETYAGHLCLKGCFSSYELTLAAGERDDAALAQRMTDEAQDTADTAEAERRRRRFDFRTGTYRKDEPKLKTAGKRRSSISRSRHRSSAHS